MAVEAVDKKMEIPNTGCHTHQCKECGCLCQCDCILMRQIFTISKCQWCRKNSYVKWYINPEFQGMRYYQKMYRYFDCL